MVIQKAVDNLKEKPKEERKAVAGGIAFGVVVILFLAWAFLFFKKIQHGGQLRQLGGSAQDEFNFSSVRDAQKNLMQGFTDTDELRAIRDQSSDRSGQNTVLQEQEQGGTDPFGQP